MSHPIGEFDTPESFKVRREWPIDDDSETKRPKPKVGQFGRQISRKKSSACCKCILVLLMALALTQAFFYYTGTSTYTFDYKRAAPLANFLESFTSEYGFGDDPMDFFDNIGADPSLKEDRGAYDFGEEEAANPEDEAADQMYDNYMKQASDTGDDMGDNSDILEEVLRQEDSEDGEEPKSEDEEVIYAEDLEGEFQDDQLYELVNSTDTADQLMVDDNGELIMDSIDDQEQALLVQTPKPPILFVPRERPLPSGPAPPPNAMPEQPKEKELFNIVFDSASKMTRDTTFKGSYGSDASQNDYPTGPEPTKPPNPINDQQLLQMLTKPPAGGSKSMSAEEHLQTVLQNFESEINQYQQPASPLGFGDVQAKPTPSPYTAKVLEALVRNKNDPNTQAQILKDIMEWKMSQNNDNANIQQAKPFVAVQPPAFAPLGEAPLAAQSLLPQQQDPVQSLLQQQQQQQQQLLQQGPVAQAPLPSQSFPSMQSASQPDELDDMLNVEQAVMAPGEAQSALSAASSSQFLYGYFPDGFMWSVATAAFQVEGGWNEGGKGKSIWDVFTHEGNVEDRSNAHVACDSYHRYQEDVEMLKQLGVKNYRFSIAWSRIQPTGMELVPNRYGVLYYNKLIDALLEAGIQPVVTLYHWDLPQALQDQGGWLNQTLVVKAFTNYAKICFTEFGDRVKFWITINEPSMISWIGYGRGKKAPGVRGESDLVYIAGHNIIVAHSTVYHMYQKYFQKKQKGFVGISLNIVWKEPKTDSPADIAATDRAMQFDLGWFAEPIYGSGDYPEAMKKQVARKSMENGLPRSRLPSFSAADIERNKGSSDFFGVNSYTSRLVEHFPQPNRKPTYFKDQDVKYTVDPSWDIGPRGRAIHPEGMRRLVNWIQKSYGPRPIYVTENGISDELGMLNDTHRIEYLKGYINSLLKAITIDGIRVVGYTVWSLMDNFEWERGYQEKLGLYHVDFHDPDRRRTPKESAKFYAKLIADNGFPPPES